MRSLFISGDEPSTNLIRLLVVSVLNVTSPFELPFLGGGGGERQEHTHGTHTGKMCTIMH